MKKTTRRVLAVLMTAAMVGTLGLFGCTGGSTTSAGSSASSGSKANGGVPASDITLQVFAANSLSKAMPEVQALYTKNTGVKFADSQYEASGTLNEMLGGGAYADVLITASKGTMDTAQEKGYIKADTRFDMFKNELVIVAGSNNNNITSVKLEDIASGRYTLAVGDANVPAGNYAKQSLSTTTPACWISADGKKGSETAGKEGTFDGTPLAGKVTEGSSVGNVCSYANSGDVDIAMVYSSDVYRFGNVKIVGTTPANTHKKIVYPAAVCTNSNYADASNTFLKWAFSDAEAIKIWQKWGFEIA